MVAGLQNDLYVYMMDTVQDTLKPVEKQKPEEPVPDEFDLERLRKLANEYEIAEDIDTAEKRHQERLVVANDPQVCYKFLTTS